MKLVSAARVFVSALLLDVVAMVPACAEDVHSLAGFLCYCSIVLPPLKPCINGLWDALRASGQHTVPMSPAQRAFLADDLHVLLRVHGLFLVLQ